MLDIEDMLTSHECGRRNHQNSNTCHWEGLQCGALFLFEDTRHDTGNVILEQHALIKGRTTFFIDAAHVIFIDMIEHVAHIISAGRHDAH